MIAAGSPSLGPSRAAPKLAAAAVSQAARSAGLDNVSFLPYQLHGQNVFALADHQELSGGGARWLVGELQRGFDLVAVQKHIALPNAFQFLTHRGSLPR